MTDTEASCSTYPYLDGRQLARVHALQAARSVLVARPPFGTEGKADAMDLYQLASYVITGEDPWPPGAPLPLRTFDGNEVSSGEVKTSDG